MGIGVILFNIASLLVIISTSSEVYSPSVVEGSLGDSVTLPCDGSAYSGLPDVQLDFLWQTFDWKKVAHYSQGDYIVGSDFSNRVKFDTEKIRRGDFSITINSVESSDQDTYVCVWRKGRNDQKFLSDVVLHVLKPHPKSFSVAVNDSVTLPCYGGVNKYEPDKLFVQWERGGDLVLKISSEGLTYGPKYEGRASVHFKRIRKGDFSLSLSVTGLCDSGVYQCSTDQKHNVTSVLLELKDYGHFQSVNLRLGKPFSLSLPEEPMNVIFSKGGTFPEVSLCSTDTELRCEPKYKNRMEWKSNTLTVLNVTSDDVGTYSVIFSENCVISRAYSLNVIHSNTATTSNRKYFVFPILLVIAVLCIVYIAWRVWRYEPICFCRFPTKINQNENALRTAPHRPPLDNIRS
ncbi:uncharacterized protein LOC133131651 [Conger conger]|uniref:uncharacterized protein LOC133131651 n=1 Tax=Conger conger TaxID=82655 RepID=UPI002A5AB258|nr:uncharacterized protein LOC133131651 [Conger conger]XP_061103028.1 uncharacterized protein LOC133131651 [Conger conger]